MKKIYLAIPYTGMTQSSYEQANNASVLILNKGFNVFSPITHSHPFTLLDKYKVPHTWDYWQYIDYQFIDWADEVWVLIPKEGIKPVWNSTGVQAEIKYADGHNKKVRTFTVVNDEIQFVDEEKETNSRRHTRSTKGSNTSARKVPL